MTFQHLLWKNLLLVVSHLQNISFSRIDHFLIKFKSPHMLSEMVEKNRYSAPHRLALYEDWNPTVLFDSFRTIYPVLDAWRMLKDMISTRHGKDHFLRNRQREKKPPGLVPNYNWFGIFFPQSKLECIFHSPSEIYIKTLPFRCSKNKAARNWSNLQKKTLP